MVKIWMLVVGFQITLLFATSFVFAQNLPNKTGDTHVVSDAKDKFDCINDTRNRWKVYNRKKGVYLPYIGNPHHTIYFQIYNTDPKFLQLTVPPKTAVFIDGQLIKVLEENNSFLYINTEKYFSDTNKTIVVSLYHYMLTKYALKTCVGEMKPVHIAKDIAAKKDNHVFFRTPGSFKLFAILVSLFLLAVLLNYCNMYHSIVEYYFNYKEILSQTTRKDISIFSRLNNVNHHFFLFIIAMFIAFLFVVILDKNLDNIFSFNTTDVEKHSFWTYVSEWITYVFIVYFSLLIKMLLVKVLGSLMGLEKLFKIHVFEFFRMSFYIYLGAFALTILYVLSTFDPVKLDFSLIGLFVSVLAFVRILLLGRKLYPLCNKQTLFMMSYLGITDLLPFVVGIKMFFFY